MYPLLEVALTQSDRFAELLDAAGPTQLGNPTPCAGWSVEDLSRHVAAGLFTAAEAFHRARFGTLSPPAELTLEVASTDLADRIRIAGEHLRCAVDRGPEQWPDIPLRFGRYPIEPALQCLVIEYGVHYNDLMRACANPDAPFSAATIEALFGFGVRYLLLQAEPVESGPLGFTVRSPSITMSIHWDGQRWRTRADTAAPHCTVDASDDDVARLMLRRLDITDPRLQLNDPFELARLFPFAIRPL